jgi:hypothetical protein
VAFVAVTVLVLGEIHPGAAGAPSGTASVATTTTTTKPKTTHATTPTTTTVPPSKVPVLVANASGITGAAAALSSQLQGGGWDLLPPVNATTDVATSSVYYLAGFQPQAAAIASSLHVPATAVVPYTTAALAGTIGTAEVVVVAGPDISSSSTTTTTAG